MITIVGLGPGSPDNLTLGAWRELASPGRSVVLRTERHGCAPYLRAQGVDFTTCDHFYETGQEFAAVYEAISGHIIGLARAGNDLCYAVPGNPWVAEFTVRLLIEAAAKADIPLRVVDGMSSLEAVYGLLGLDVSNGLMVVDALDGDRMPMDPRQPMLITQVYSRYIASDLKLRLLSQYPPEHPVTIVSHAGSPAASRIDLALSELDFREYDHAETVYVPSLPGSYTAGQRLEQLASIMAELRDDTGCPWDQEQTHESLRPYLIEEAYEVLDAIDSGDRAKLAEELGDLLLQIVFHAQIAAEEGTFVLGDSIRLICEKLIRRHPHVFADISVSGSDEVLKNWRQIKQGERGEEASRAACILDTVPRAFPALLEAAKVQSRAREVGFDWPDISGPLAKVKEELDELMAAVAGNNSPQMLEELGDLLFAVVNLARFASVEPENALRLATAKFRRRFARVAVMAEERGLRLGQASLAELDALWDETKEKSV